MPGALPRLTELKANGQGHFVTMAEINGRAVRVMIDTGATTVALSFEDAEDAGLAAQRLDFNIPVATANGITMPPVSCSTGSRSMACACSDVEGLVLPEGAMRGSLLGMSYLIRLRSFKVEDGVLTSRIRTLLIAAAAFPHFVSAPPPSLSFDHECLFTTGNRDALRQGLRRRSRNRLLHWLRPHSAGNRQLAGPEPADRRDIMAGLPERVASLTLPRSAAVAAAAAWPR